MASSIGIKIANGEFYPILSDIKPAKKRMVLTTVHDGQRSVQIDLYRSVTRTMSDAQYIGSLVVEKIKTKKQGEASVELILSHNSTGEISAKAKDLGNPHAKETASLSVSLATLDVTDSDFSDTEADLNLESEIDTVSDLQTSSMGERPVSRTEKKRGSPLAIIIVLALLLLAGAGFALWWFVLRGSAEKGQDAFNAISAVEAPTLPVIEQFQEEEIIPIPPPLIEEILPPVVLEEPPVISAPPVPVNPPPVSRTRMTAPVHSYNVPTVIPKDGIRYKIRWGDTLWDISAAFYRNPWRYRFLARYNGIRNPNRIISGTFIKIPPI